MKTVDSSSWNARTAALRFQAVDGAIMHPQRTHSLRGPVPEDGSDVPCCTVAASGDVRAGNGTHHLSQI
jgi:hypothetical protein